MRLWRKDDPDKIVIKGKKGLWKRYIKLLVKCRMPWVLLIIYLILDVGVVNLGVNETDLTAQLFAGDTSVGLLTQLITVILFNLVVGKLVNLVEWATRVRIDQNARNALIRKVTRLPMGYFKEENPREAVYRIVENGDTVSLTLILVILPIFTSAYTAYVIFQKVFGYDWRLSVILVAFIPVSWALKVFFGRITFSVGTTSNMLHSKLMSRLAEMITNIPLAKAFGKEDRETKRGAELTERMYNLSIKSGWIGMFQDVVEGVVSMCKGAFLVLIGAMLLRGETITTRGWVSFFMFSGTFSSAINSFMMYWGNIKTLQGRSDRIAEIMDAPEEKLTGEPCANLTGDLAFQNVQFGYVEGKTVLQDVSCTFPDKSVTALLGVNGCGKTTMVNLLTRLYEPNAGQITVAGKNIGDYALRDYRKQFAMVPQEGMLFSGTIRENVSYGNGKVPEEDLLSVLKKAGAYDFVMAMGGLDARLEEYGGNLSGGQRQRLVMARALLSKARYFILDEPTSAMDAAAANELMQVLLDAAQDRCVIIIAHSSAVLSLAQRVVVVEDGMVTAQGTVDDVTRTSQFLRDLGKVGAEA